MTRKDICFVVVARAIVIMGCAGVVAAGTLEPPAGPVAPTMKTLDEVEPRSPIFQSDLPLTINVDGSYYLVSNLYANQIGVDMITVTADNVSIDLNGFTISGLSELAQAADCIDIDTGVETFALSNGVIRNCGQNGVRTNAGTTTFSIDRIQVINNGGSGLSLGTNSYGVVSRCVAKSNGSSGILLFRGVIRDSSAFSNGSNGFLLVDGLIHGSVALLNGTNVLINGGGQVVDTYAP